MAVATVLLTGVMQAPAQPPGFSCTAGWHEPVTRIPQGIHHSLYVTGYNSPANERSNTPMTTMRNTVVAVWMAAAAATIGLAAPAHADDTQYAKFLSPSGNINCSIMLLAPFAVSGVDHPGNNVVQCELVDHTWQPPQGCATASEVVGVSIRADATAPPVVDCGKYANQLPLPWPTLEYGQTRTLGVITCDSEPSGITCTNSNTGHFFRLSRESYDVG